MEELTAYFVKYGLIPTAIAIVGIIILGILKYCNLFKKIDEKWRHYIYIGIALAFSLIATAIYLLIAGRFNAAEYFITAGILFALDQTWYNIFKVTPVNELVKKIVDKIVAWAKEHFKKSEPPDDGAQNSGEETPPEPPAQ